MGRLGILELIIIFVIAIGPILAAIFMAGYLLGKKKGFNKATKFFQNEKST